MQRPSNDRYPAAGRTVDGNRRCIAAGADGDAGGCGWVQSLRDLDVGILISLLIGLRDRFRIWVLGSLFIIASAALYFLFMAAWLNMLLFLGMLQWISLLVGLRALGGGGYYLHEYLANPEAFCKVTAPAGGFSDICAP